MKNWEQMQGFSYVGIKITKAKSITQGLTKCKIQKLTRNNPVYQHLRYHKKYHTKSYCEVCTKRDITNRTRPILNIKNQQNSQSRRCKTQKLNKVQTSQIEQIQQNKKIGVKSARFCSEKSKTRCLTPRETASQQGRRKKNAFERFEQQMKESRQYFKKIEKDKQITQNYFYTTVDLIDHQFNEDKGLSIEQTREENSKIKRQLNQHKQKMIEMKKRAKQLAKPIKFPFSKQQISNIILADNKIMKKQSKKLNSMLTSIYDYKSKSNYCNRMKIIDSIIKN